MKKVTWTCWVDEEKKAKGAVVGTRKSVLDWMRKTYPGLRKAWNGEMTPAWYFFWENDAEHYQSADGEDLYLVRCPAEEERKAPSPEEEKALEQALKNYRKTYAKKYPDQAACEVRGAKKIMKSEKMMDEEVAEEVAKAIWKTAHLRPWEQKEKLEGFKNSDYVLNWSICSFDMWSTDALVNRLMHDEAAAREYLCNMFYRKDKAESKVFCSRIRSGKFIHLQMTRAFTGGMDAYIAFRTPRTRNATIVRFCYK